MTVRLPKVAVLSEVVAVAPPGKGMKATPATLVAADIAGCDRIFKVGGPWGVAGLAYGTKQCHVSTRSSDPGISTLLPPRCWFTEGGHRFAGRAK